MKHSMKVVLALAFCLSMILAVSFDAYAAKTYVGALYPTNGSNWNDYIVNDGLDNLTATDTACTGDETGGYSACLHGGGMRAFEVRKTYTCAGITASDAFDAFNWVCDESTSPVRMVSTGLKDGKNLSDLLDFATPGWKPNSVIVYEDGFESLTTESTTWWTNPVVIDNDGGSLDTAGTIYVVTNDALTPATGGYIINASSIGLVGQPGVIINGPANGVGSYVVTADGSINAKDFLWIEGTVDASGDNRGISLEIIRLSVLRNLKVQNADAYVYPIYTKGIYFGYSSNNTLTDITVSNNKDFGIYLENSSNNTVSGISSFNNAYGLYLWGSSNNMLTGITSFNQGGGVNLTNSWYNTFSGITSSNNYGVGIEINYSWYNTFTGITASDNSTGVAVYNSRYNAFSGLALDNVYQSVSLDNAHYNYFTGPLKVGSPFLYTCYVVYSTDPGLVAETCANQGASDATLTTGVTLADSHIGMVTTDDSVNQSDINGAAPYASITDWTNFENSFRGWGDGRSYFCRTGTCYIRDLSAAISDTVIKDSLYFPTGNDTLVHTWSDLTTTTMLRNAVEIDGDGIGNENTLCESGETCLYMPNMGSYQGHGDLVSAGPFTDGTITGVTMLMYDTNGR